VEPKSTDPPRTETASVLRLLVLSGPRPWVVLPGQKGFLTRGLQRAPHWTEHPRLLRRLLRYRPVILLRLLAL